MPLQSVPDPFDDATHRLLDAAVNMAMYDAEVTTSLTKYDCAYLLTLIVGHSNHVLDDAYLGLRNALTLVKAYDDLQHMLNDTWTRKSYREIRSLAILQGLPTSPNYVDPGHPDVHRSSSMAFELEYRGAAVDAFYEYLTHNMSLFKKEYNPRYFAKVCPMIQSSGTGKSRLLLELCKKNSIVLYMNLRDGNDFTGFPARDRIPSKILTDFSMSKNEDGYRFACCAFFTALFVVLEEHLLALLASDNGKAGIKHWAEQMCSVSYPPRFTAREEFFTKVTAKYLKLRVEMNLPSRRLFIDHVYMAYVELCKCLQEIFPTHSDEPMVVIAIDEAQGLATNQGVDQYCPVDTLYKVANEFSHAYGNHAVWVVFASTASEIVNFTPPKTFSGDRFVYVGRKLFAPYTELGWDQNALDLGDVSVDDISKLRHITSYGRPLWHSLVSVATTQSSIVETISLKLCGGKAFDPKETGHVLAVLGQRFALNISFGHPDSAAHVDTGVINHLRICHRMTLDRSWKFTSYPSEPLLSCVAAHHLHHEPRSLETALMTLENNIRHGVVDLGQRAELTSRFLWLLAKDLYIRDNLHEPSEILTKTLDGGSRGEEVVDCQMIPVVRWLEFVFGEQTWDKTQGSLVREHFQDAFLNFSHWISMTNAIAGSGDDDYVELPEWTLRHWQRTSAVQCCSHEPLVDQIIPIYFKEPGTTAVSGKRVSQIFIRNEALKYAHSKDHLSEFTRKDIRPALEDNRRVSDAEMLPYITILADFGRPSELEVTYTESDVDDRCLRIYAAGIDATIYAFLSNRPRVLTTLEKLIQRQQIPETETPIAAYLAAQFGFGSTGLPQHMHWEHGRRVPELRRESDG